MKIDKKNNQIEVFSHVKSLCLKSVSLFIKTRLHFICKCVNTFLIFGNFF